MEGTDSMTLTIEPPVTGDEGEILIDKPLLLKTDRGTTTMREIDMEIGVLIGEGMCDCVCVRGCLFRLQSELICAANSCVCVCVYVYVR